MIGRFIKVFWFFTLFGSMASLLYVYAGLSQESQVFISDADKLFSNKETFFYTGLAVLATLNFVFYTLSKNLRYKSEKIQTTLVNWFISFSGILNILYIALVHFVFLINSGENVDFSNFSYLVFTAIGLVLIWILVLPYFIIKAVK